MFFFKNLKIQTILWTMEDIIFSKNRRIYIHVYILHGLEFFRENKRYTHPYICKRFSIKEWYPHFLTYTHEMANKISKEIGYFTAFVIKVIKLCIGMKNHRLLCPEFRKCPQVSGSSFRRTIELDHRDSCPFFLNLLFYFITTNLHIASLHKFYKVKIFKFALPTD